MRKNYILGPVLGTIVGISSCVGVYNYGTNDRPKEDFAAESAARMCSPVIGLSLGGLVAVPFLFYEAARNKKDKR